MDRFENMEIFNQVVETGSISRAAERAGVAKSAVSRRLKELEGHLGVELFHRTTRQMNLTDTGRSFYRLSVRIIEDVREAERSAAQVHSALEGRLKVALPATFGLEHLGPAISEFLSEHPNIEFDLDFNDRLVDIMQEGFDLAIRIAKLEDSTLIAKRLAPIRHVICASPTYLDEYGTPQSPAELLNHRCLMYNLTDSDQWSLQNTQGEIVKAPVSPYLNSSSGDFLCSVAVGGFGIVQLPSFIVYKEIERGALVPLLNDYQRTDLSAHVLYPHTRHLSARVRAFVDFLAIRFQGTPYWDECLTPEKQ